MVLFSFIELKIPLKSLSFHLSTILKSRKEKPTTLGGYNG
jgi:hypothetical protein